MKSIKKYHVRRSLKVADDSDIKKAKRKGLFKETHYLSPEKNIRLSGTHIPALIVYITDRIRNMLRKWLEMDGEQLMDRGNEHYILTQIEELLYIIDSLLPYQSTFYKEGLESNPDTEFLFNQLRLIREIIAFPPQIEAFYSAYKKGFIKYFSKEDHFSST